MSAPATPSMRQQILRHALGLDRETGAGAPWRNHYVAMPGSAHYVLLQQMVLEGVLSTRPSHALSGAGVFFVTGKGLAEATAQRRHQVVC